MSDDLINTVYIKRCEQYDRDAIHDIVMEGMSALKYEPRGKIFAKPNVVTAHLPELVGKDACTHSDVIGGSLLALAESPGVERVDLGENSAVGFPTRMCYKYAGYYDEVDFVKRKAPKPVDIFCIDEHLRDIIFIGGKVHDTLKVSRKMARADSKVYLPKLKCHCVTNLTATVKLNIGICSFDDRSIRHDFMLSEKIVDLLTVGWPDFTVMDAIDIGVGNEGFPILRKLGLIVMGRNPIAVDLVGGRLLGLSRDDVPYLKIAAERGYKPSGIEEVRIAGDLKSLDDVDEAAKRVMPYDDEFYRWQDIDKELNRLNSPMKFHWGPYRGDGNEKCKTGCVMGMKMFFACLEKFAGAEAFQKAHPASFVMGNVTQEIDARGGNVYLIGSCAKANLKNARKVIHLDRCFTTVSDMMIQFGWMLGMPAPITERKFVVPIALGMLESSFHKIINFRYLQDIWYFISKKLDKRI